jgi:hypothetical protein
MHVSSSHLGGRNAVILDAMQREGLFEGGAGITLCLLV